jgi:hypothetical protein
MEASYTTPYKLDESFWKAKNNPQGEREILVGSFVQVECDVVPMDVCHLLLGRPWEYDLNATHEGCFNHYSFVHKGLHHVLKPMLECAINAEVFPTITKKKKNSDISPKSRMTLFQGAENDMSISNATNGISVSNSTIIDAANASNKSLQRV